MRSELNSSSFSLRTARNQTFSFSGVWSGDLQTEDAVGLWLKHVEI